MPDPIKPQPTTPTVWIAIEDLRLPVSGRGRESRDGPQAVEAMPGPRPDLVNRMGTTRPDESPASRRLPRGPAEALRAPQPEQPREPTGRRGGAVAPSPVDQATRVTRSTHRRCRA